MSFGKRVQYFSRELRTEIATELLGGHSFTNSAKHAERLFVDAARDLLPDMKELHQPPGALLKTKAKDGHDSVSPFVNRILTGADSEIAPLAAIFLELHGNRDESAKAFKLIAPEKAMYVKSWLDNAARLNEASKPDTSKIDLRSEIGNLTFLEWMKRHGADPNLWHMLARHYSDDLLPTYEWIVNHQDCDAGTAATLFHVLNAFEYYEMPPARLDELRVSSVQFRIVETAVQRWMGNRFKTNRFTVYEMGYEEPIQGYERRAQKVTSKHGVSMLGVVPGMFNYDRGIPEQTKYKFHI